MASQPSVAEIDAAKREATTGAVSEVLSLIPVVGELASFIFDIVNMLASHGSYPTDSQLVPWFVLGARPQTVARLMASARNDPEIGTARAGFGLVLRILHNSPRMKAIVCPKQPPPGFPSSTTFGFPVCVGGPRARTQFNTINGERISEDNWLGQVWFWDAHINRTRVLSEGEIRVLQNVAGTGNVGWRVGVAQAIRDFQLSRNAA